jgi:hypothetical protein
LSLSGLLKKNLRSPFESLRANGGGIDIIEYFPFMLRLSKHEKPVLQHPVKRSRRLGDGASRRHGVK